MEELKRLRLAAGMTQDELGAAAGVAQHTISEIESGKRQARPSTLRKLAGALQCDVRDFFADPSGKGAAGPPRLHDFANVLHYLRLEVARAEEGELTTRERDGLFDDIEMLLEALPDKRSELTGEEYGVLRRNYLDIMRRLVVVCEREETRARERKDALMRGLEVLEAA